MEAKTFNVPATKKTAVEIQLGKFNKRAHKMGMDTLSFSWGKAFEDDGTLFLPIEVVGNLSVTFDGWEFKTSLQHLKTGENIIRNLDKDFQVPEKYRSGSNCEHCQVKRYRKDTYLLSHTNGDIIQVGSTCIDNFLGGKSPEDILKKASLIAELNSYMEGTATGGTGGDVVFSIVEFLANAIAIIKEFGWLSKTKASIDGSTSTASRVLDNLVPYAVGGTLTKVTREDFDKAKLITDWAEDLTDEECHNSDYLHNLRAIARSGIVGMRAAGFAASMVQAYDKAVQIDEPKTLTSNSIHIGSIKSRIEIPLTLKFDFTFISAYGEGHRYIFNDDTGNVLVWRASKNNHLEVGKKYDIKGTIKAHGDYRGVLQTELTRCEITSIYE
jgi:hypothetical protein